MNSSDKLWELKKLEYKRDGLDRRLETRWGTEKLLGHSRLPPEFMKDSCLMSSELKDLNAQISKLLEDE